MSKLVSIVAAALVLAGFVPANIVQAGGGPGPVVELNTPELAMIGKTPFFINVVVKNPTDNPTSFDGIIWHGGLAWGGEDNPYEFSAGTDVYWVECDSGGCYHWWRGELQSGASASFWLPTFTGWTTGTHTIARTTFLLTNGGRVRENERAITLRDEPITATVKNDCSVQFYN